MGLFRSVKVINSGKAILLSPKSKHSVPIRYHSTWLMDNALDDNTRDKKNGQRLITISDIPAKTYIKSASIDKKGKEINIVFLPKKKQVKFSTKWLKDNAYDNRQAGSKVWINPDLKTWSKNSLKRIPIINYKTAKSNKKLLINWLKSLNSFGFARINGCEKKMEQL